MEYWAWKLCPTGKRAFQAFTYQIHEGYSVSVLGMASRNLLRPTLLV